jgi:solute carrier family 25 carnitine/acylcarnitine transporter 20/29
LQDSYTLPGVAALLIAACFSGFVTSFLVTPIERIKVLLQSSNAYKNEIDCFQKVIEVEGVIGIFTRGLGPTLAREIPSYGIYFLIYGLLMQLPLATQLGTLAPLIFGAVTGCASWIPVYPIDVVKTLVQASDGSQNVSALEITKQLYNDRGIRGFFDGLTPKMLRAAVNHSVTFYIYDMIYHTLIV